MSAFDEIEEMSELNFKSLAAAFAIAAMLHVFPGEVQVV